MKSLSLSLFCLLFTRLDKNNAAYDLIWEDREVLSGKVNQQEATSVYPDIDHIRCKVNFQNGSFTFLSSFQSFYLPGSVDVHDKTLEDWNLKPPPLYLWSRRDWTARHEAIAQEHGHIFKEQPEMCLEGKNAQNYLVENCGFFWDHTGLHPPGDIGSILDYVPEKSYETKREGTEATVSPSTPTDMGNWHSSLSGTNLGNRCLYNLENQFQGYQGQCE